MSLSTCRDAAMPILARLSAMMRRPGEHDAARGRALTAFAIRVGSAAIAYLSQVLLARWMGAFEFGIFAYVWVWVVVLGTLVNAGFNTSVLRFVPEYAERGELPLLRGFIGTGSGVALGVGGLATLAGMAVVAAAGDGIAGHYVTPLVLALCCLPAFALSDTKDGLGRSRGWIGLALTPPYIVRPLLILVLMAGAVVFGAPPTAITACGAAIAATWAVAAGQTLLIRRQLAAAVPPGPASYRLGPWIRISLPIMLVDGFYLIMANTDVVMLTMAVGPGEIAVYYAVIKTTGLIAFVQFSVTAACGPKFSEYRASGRHDALDHLLAMSIRWSFWPSLAAAVAIIAAGVPLLALFGPEFVAGYPLMFILMIGLLARASTGPVEAVMTVTGEQDAVAWTLATGAVANIALNLTLIPSWGATGAAVATTASMCMVAALQYLVARRRLGIHAFIIGAVAAQQRT